ncbi:MAG: FAD:protein FMN transferase [Psychromonas sp.]
MHSQLTIKKQQNGQGYIGIFQAMASDCEVLIDCDNMLLAKQMISAVFIEAKRIEAKYSRYLQGNTLDKINTSNGEKICLDDETILLVNFAYQCYQLSAGLFDISSGVLRRAWHFDGSDNIPKQKQINRLLPLIGLDKLIWDSPYLTLPKGMQLDFGGIGKEYAVDCCLITALQVNKEHPILINFGGDLICNQARRNGTAWHVGIERVGGGEAALIKLKRGALATSGDARRYLLKEGIRYSHILNPQTGYSIIDAPRSITVAAESCIEAGLLSTIAMLQGAQAKSFLMEQQIKYWIQD